MKIPENRIPGIRSIKYPGPNISDRIKTKWKLVLKGKTAGGVLLCMCVYVRIYFCGTGRFQKFAFVHSQFELLVRYPCKILRRLFGISVWNLGGITRCKYMFGSFVFRYYLKP